MASLDTAMDDYTAAVFLRYFRRGAQTSLGAPHVNPERDVDLLRKHWALSAEVRDLLGHILSHRHEAQSLLHFRRQTHDAIARGRIDARATLRERLVTGHPSVVVAEEPVRSFNTGPNMVVAWVVQTAAVYAGRLLEHQAMGSAYMPLIEDVMAAVAAVKRIEALREPLKIVSLHRRPSPGALQLASRARRMIYRKAVTAYRTLTAMEAGDEEAMRRVFSSTLFGPLEKWRRFELAVAVGIGEVLEEMTGVETHLAVLATSDGAPILVCGDYALYWQSGGGLFTPPPLEPSERRLGMALAAYGMKLAGDRPDLVLVDRIASRVVAIIEVKYLAGDTAAARFREAAGQIVRYARGYVSDPQIENLIRSSLIALSSGAPAMQDEAAAAPRAVDFAGLTDGRLHAWARDRLPL